MEDPFKILAAGAGGMLDLLPASALPDAETAEERNTDGNTPYDKALRAGRVRESDLAIVASPASIIPYEFVRAGTTYRGALVSAGNTFHAFTGGSATSLTAPVTITAGSVWRGAVHGAGVCLQNGVNPPLYFDGSATLKRLSIFKPAVDWSDALKFTSTELDTTGALGQIKTHIRLTYYNSARGVESNPSATTATGATINGDFEGGEDVGTFLCDLTAMAGSDNNFAITILEAEIATLDPQIDWIYIYRTVGSADGSNTQFYLDGTNSVPGSGNWNYNHQTDGGLSDTALAAATPMETYRDDAPVSATLVPYERRMFYAGEGTTVSPYTKLPAREIVFSAFDYPEYVRYFDQASSSTEDSFELNEDSSDVLGGVDFGDELFLASGQSCYSLNGLGNGEYVLRRASAQHGAVAKRGFAAKGNTAFFVATDGIYRYAGGAVDKISEAIQGTWDTLNASRLSSASLCYHAVTDKLYCAVSSAGASVNDMLLVLELRTLGGAVKPRWKIWDGIYLVDMCVSAGAHDATDTTRRLYGIDDMGYLWRLETGDCEAELSDGSGSANTKSGTLVAADTVTNNSITDADASFYTGANDGLAGVSVWVHDADGDNVQVRRVSSNTGTKITVNSNWTVNPATGWSYAVGGMRFRIKTASAALSTSAQQATVTGVSVHHLRGSATDDAELFTRLYLDDASTATASTTLNIGSATEGEQPAAAWTGAATQGYRHQLELEGVYVDRAVHLMNARVFYTPSGVHD